jgi:hypothetical protein
MSSAYSTEFYLRQKDGSLQSAKEIVPLIIGLVNPKSVIDVGCGIGTWLSVFRNNDISDIQGIDGGWVPLDMLLIPKENFSAFDLKKPFAISRRFDLVVCLEVAEHLPQEDAGALIDSLTKLAPVVLFSAAVPHQGGDNHINEQWPEYWAALFGRKGYLPVDCIRKRIWKNDKVEWWYAQNLLLFVEKKHLWNNQKLMEQFEKTDSGQLSIVHPRMYLAAISHRESIFNVMHLRIGSCWREIRKGILRTNE